MAVGVNESVKPSRSGPVEGDGAEPALGDPSSDGRERAAASGTKADPREPEKHSRRSASGSTYQDVIHVDCMGVAFWYESGMVQPGLVMQSARMRFPDGTQARKGEAMRCFCCKKPLRSISLVAGMEQEW